MCFVYDVEKMGDRSPSKQPLYAVNKYFVSVSLHSFLDIDELVKNITDG